jgi:sec-independent protein translocase protein TatA
LVVETVGPVELLIVLVVVLLLFGSKKLPELARGMGQAATEFRRGLRGQDDPSPSGARAAEETVTMTRAELDALMAEHEARARHAQPSSGPDTSADQ